MRSVKLERREPAPARVSAHRDHAAAADDDREASAQRIKQERLANASGRVARQQEIAALTDSAVSQRARASNATGLPDRLQTGIESLSSMPMDGVKVHYNSSRPAGLMAHAYTHGNDIYVAPGQERHLPHEAWHVVQQAQGRVKPTRQLRSQVPVNDDPALESEADVMGSKALSVAVRPPPGADTPLSSGEPVAHRTLAWTGSVAQRMPVAQDDLQKSFNVRLPSNKMVVGKLVNINGGGWYTFEVNGSPVLIRGHANIVSRAANGSNAGSASSSSTATAMDLEASESESESESDSESDSESESEARSDQDDPVGAFSTAEISSEDEDEPTLGVERQFETYMDATMAAETGHSLEDLRGKTATMTHNAGLSSGTTKMAGRFITMRGPKVLGDTQYAKFLPRLHTDTGLTHQDLAAIIEAGLLQDETYQQLMQGLNGDQREMVAQTVTLFHNEILHRSSTNLVTIVHELRRAAENGDNIAGRLLKKAKLAPTKGQTVSKTGGQEYSQIGHEIKRYKTHKRGTELLDHFRKTNDVELEEMWQQNKKLWKGLRRECGDDPGTCQKFCVRGQNS